MTSGLVQHKEPVYKAQRHCLFLPFHLGGADLPHHRMAAYEVMQQWGCI